MRFASWEQITLVVLTIVTLAVFGRDLRAKIAQILPGRSDRPRTDRLGERLWRVVREVIFQERVVGGRPVAGGMHAVVFLGFLAFALETVDHFLEPFHVPLLAAIFGGTLPWFQGFLVVVAAAVAIAISGLAFRRFVMVKVSPDPTSYSSGVVALLILLLMLTYIDGVADDLGWLPFEPLAPKANWWVHSLIILVFPHLILRSKHFHILMAPVDIFFRTHGLGDYLPLELDLEKLEEAGEEPSFGLESMADVPWKMRMDFLTCVECKRCTEQCPAWNCGQELNPRGFILAGREALGSEGPGPDGPVIGNVISETALGQCTSCGACESICPVGIEHLQLLIGAKRAQALSTGKGMVATNFLQTVERYGNPFSEPASAREKLIAELGLPIFEPGKSEYLLWLGCVWSYNQDARSSLEAMVKILNAADVRWGVLERESCSGHHSRRQGEELQFQTLAEDNIASLEQIGDAKVVAPCPHCLHTMRREYPTLKDGFRLETLHHSELIADLVAQGALKPRRGNGADGKLHTYHDPCYLGRYEGVYDAPRNLIEGAGHRMVELSRHGAKSFCCGGGNAGFTAEREEERRVDQERSDEIRSSGAQVLVTSCPECKMMLGTATSETKDLAELVAESL